MELTEFLEMHKMNEIEEEFVRQIFFPYTGERGLDYLQAQTPFEDFNAKKRRLDFTIRTDKYSYCMEIDGYIYHAEGAMRVSEDYFDDLLVKQNDLILSGWKLLRFSYNQITKKPAQCDEVHHSVPSWMQTFVVTPDPAKKSNTTSPG